MRRKLSFHNFQPGRKDSGLTTLREAETSLVIGSGSCSWALAVPSGLSRGHKELRRCIFRRLELETQAPLMQSPELGTESIVNITTRPIAKQIRGLCLSESLSNRHKRGRIWLRATSPSPTFPPLTAPAQHSQVGEPSPCQKLQDPITTSLRAWGEGRRNLKRLPLETEELPDASLRNWADDKGQELREYGSSTNYSDSHLSL